MKIQLGIIPLLISTLLIASGFIAPTTGKSPLRIQIQVVQKNEQLWADMTFSNQSTEPIYLNKLDIGMSSRLMNNLFLLQQNGREVPYAGILVKRRAATLDDFVLLQPGKSVKTKIRLDQSYRFKPGKQRYSIQYRHYHGSPKDSSVLREFASQKYFFSYRGLPSNP